MPDVSVLEVLLHNKAVGALTRLGGDRYLFAFTDDYINDPERPTLSQSFKDPYGNLIVEINPTRTRVIPFLANLLPEDALRTYLAKRAQVNEKRDFFLLWVLGKDLPGAVTVRSADDEVWPSAVEDDHENDDRREHALRFSLAGVQLKFSAVMNASGGLTIPAHGTDGSWIVKLPSTKYDLVPENEFAMMTLARKLDMDVPDVKLLDLKSIANLPEDIGNLQGQALAVRRFDRTERGPVHAEDFAQVFGVYPERKYERASYRSIASVIWIETGEAGLAEYVRRLIFNALIGNADMHLKNWSLVYPQRRSAALAPGYDFVSTVAFLPDPKMALTFGHSKKWSELSLKELQYFAGKAELPARMVVNEAKAAVERFRDTWNAEKTHLPLTDDSIDAVEKHVETIPLVKEVG